MCEELKVHTLYQGWQWLVNFFFKSDLFYLLIAGVKCDCCTRTHSVTNTLSRTALDDGSTCLKGLYLHDTPRSQETNVHTPSGIWTHNPSRRVASDPHLTPHGHWDRLEWLITVSITEARECSVIGRWVTTWYSELERMWKKAILIHYEALYCSYLEILRKTNENQ